MSCAYSPSSKSAWCTNSAFNQNYLGFLCSTLCALLLEWSSHKTNYFLFFLEQQEHLIQTKVLCSICDNHPLFQLHYWAGSSMQQIIHWMIEKSADTMCNIWSIKISKIGNLFTNKKCQVCFCLTDSTEVPFDKLKDKDERRQDKAAFSWRTD